MKTIKPTTILGVKTLLMPYLRGLSIKETEKVLDIVEDHAKEQNKELLEALKEAHLQIEYLHNKFQKTGTSESVLNRLSTIIQKYENIQ